MNYLGHPHKTSEHVKTLSFLFDFEKQRATLVKDRLDDVVVWTTVQDIAGVVARAVEYEGEWPAIGGITGTRLTVREMLQIGEAIGKSIPLSCKQLLRPGLPLTIIIGKPFTIDWLKLEDIEAEERDMGSFADFDLHTASPEVVEAFLNMALKGILLGISRGAYDITDEWNKILPDYKFTQVEDFLKKVWGGK